MIQIEQERSDLWKAEVEAGFPICKRKMVHAATFEDVMAKVAETYREMVPQPVPKPEEPTEPDIYAGSVVGGLARAVTRLREPADAQDAPEAFEAGEIETGDLAGSAGLLPSEAEDIARSEMGAAKQQADDRTRLTVSREITDGGAPSVSVRQKRQYRKRQ